MVLISIFVQSILTTKFKAGGREAYSGEDDINHTRTKSWWWVYVALEIGIAEPYSIINSYKCVFMLRLNPKNLRIPKTNNVYWIVSGHSNDIRPYRLLIKYVG